ncbi:hypothetical protein JCM6882_008443 [Rhodosporidiobolus microsporus]
MSTVGPGSSRGVGRAGDATGAKEVDEKVVSDLVKHLFDPSAPRTRSSTRAFLSPNLVIDFPFLPQPSPSSAETPASGSTASTAQALSLFRLPALAVNLLPGAEWSLKVRRVNKDEDGASLSSFASATSGSLTGPSTVPPSFTETWTAEVRWQLSLGGSSASDTKNASEEAGGGGGGAWDSDDPFRPAVPSALSKMREGAPVWRSRSEVRLVELTFAPRLLDPVEAQKKLEKEKVLSSDLDDGERRLLGETEKGVGAEPVNPWASTSAGTPGVQIEKAMVEEGDEPLQPLQLVYVRYKVPSALSTPTSTTYVPDVARRALSSAFIVLLTWLLPLLNALLVFLNLDSAHILAAGGKSSLRRRAALHDPHRQHQQRDKKGKSTHQSRRRDKSASQVDVAPFGTPPLPLAREDDPFARLAAFSSESEDVRSAAAAGGQEHPSHVGRSRRWSVSTAASGSEYSAEGGHPAHRAASSLPKTLDSAYTSARSSALELASSVSALSNAARGVVEDMGDVAWTIRRGVVFVTELVAAVGEVGRGVVTPEGGSREGSKERGVKRRLSGEKEGEEKRAKHWVGEDVGSAGGGEEEGEGEGGGDGQAKSPVSPVSPTSPPKSAMSTNGHKSTSAHPSIKKRVSFSASSDFILPPASPAPRQSTVAATATPPLPPPATAVPSSSSTTTDALSLLHNAAASSAAAAALARPPYDPSHGIRVPSDAVAGAAPAHDVAAAEAALLASAERGVDAAARVERAEELEGVRAERSLRREEHEKEAERVEKVVKTRQGKKECEEALLKAVEAEAGDKDAKEVKREARARVDELEDVKLARQVRRAERSEDGEEEGRERLEALFGERGRRMSGASVSAEGAGEEGEEGSEEEEGEEGRRGRKVRGGRGREDWWTKAKEDPLPAEAEAEDVPLPASRSSSSPSKSHRSSRLPSSVHADEDTAPTAPRRLPDLALPPTSESVSGQVSGQTSATASGIASPFSGLASFSHSAPASTRPPPMMGTKTLADILRGLEPGERRTEGVDTPLPVEERRGLEREMSPVVEAKRESEGKVGKTVSATATAAEDPSSDSDPDLPGSTTSLPLAANTASKLAHRSMLDSTGLGRPSISAPRRLGVEEVPTPPGSVRGVSREGSTEGKKEHRRRESEEERQERVRPTGVRVSSGRDAEEEKDDGETPTAASFAEAVKNGGAEGEAGQQKKGKEEGPKTPEEQVDLSEFYTPPTHPSQPAATSSSRSRLPPAPPSAPSSTGTSPTTSLSSLPSHPHHHTHPRAYAASDTDSTASGSAPNTAPTSPETPMKAAFVRLGAEASPVDRFGDAEGSAGAPAVAHAGTNKATAHKIASTGGWGDEAAPDAPDAPEPQEEEQGPKQEGAAETKQQGAGGAGGGGGKKKKNKKKKRGSGGAGGGGGGAGVAGGSRSVSGASVASTSSVGAQ